MQSGLGTDTLRVVNGIVLGHFYLHPGKFCFESHGKRKRLALVAMHHKDFSRKWRDRQDVGEEFITIHMSASEQLLLSTRHQLGGDTGFQ